ncbi:MarR family winged helix-turn-helix transcriptional regulator [Saccharothrix longispora]|uniref:MarR family winged helix-turn-helix transcriptional regulator n=1 Tax=Saccharothrix longispora TaxID=33920 RepID=UPI0028FD1298|nr:MarR family transcriptional regulator [Saccharothrix longispora]MBY8847480.1 MarR family transcriptional regulator [Saccharothrix sp. MB29]MDU0289115.1 MarR family transcriptional regulator [Saccharothrix longispora]
MSDVRWLSAEEQQVWRGFMTAVTKFTEHLDRQLQRDSGMPMAYYEILVALSEAPDRAMRMSELASVCLSSRSRLSHAVARLEKEGWVERRACASDRRGSIATLTDEGFAVLREAAPGHVAAVREHLFDVLTPEQLRALASISRAVDAGLTVECDKARAELGEF